MSKRLNKEREIILQPKRIEVAKEKLISLGYEIIFEDDVEIKFIHNGNLVTLFPYSGWYSGKGIGSGRGLVNLINKLK